MILGSKPIGTISYLGGLMAVPEEFCFSLAQMIQYNCEQVCGSGEYIHLDRAKVSLHDYARNSLTQRFRGDWLLQLDTDIEFEPDTLARMLDRMYRANVDVLSALYCFKSHPFAPVIYRRNENGGYAIVGSWDGNGRDDAILPCDGFGGGCLLVRRSVFERIHNELNGEEPFTRRLPLGEDLSFADRLKDLGIQAYFDPRIRVKHLRSVGVDYSDFDPSGARFGEKQQVQALV